MTQSTPALAQLFLRTLSHLEVGSLEIVTPSGERQQIQGKTKGPRATLIIKDWRAVQRLLIYGDVGFAEAYRDHLWDTDDLAALLTLAALNSAKLESFFHGQIIWRFWGWLKHLFNRNSKGGSRKNIKAHYDLGNAFYKLWLDPSLTYSSAIFDGDIQQSLEAAQDAKYARILSRLGNAPSHILEIGCGWGGFAEAAANAGHKVTAITLSRAQAAYAKKRMEQNGLSDKVEIRIIDYRDMRETFDHVVSIEMYEAVGREYWPSYFAKIAQVLKPGGKAVIQAITIADNVFDDYASRTDFIQQYTFPGGMLASPSIFRSEAERAKLKQTDAYAFGLDYAETLRRWLAAFDEKRDEVEALGHDDAFIRLWRFYLAYCIAGFISGRTDVWQIELIHA